MSAFVAWPLANSAKNLIQAGRLHRMKSEHTASLYNFSSTKTYLIPIAKTPLLLGQFLS